MTFMISGYGRVSGSLRQEADTIDPMYAMGQGGIHAALRDLGIKSRHILGQGETQLSMAIDACERAIDDAASEQIDMLIATSAVPYQPIPSFATLIAQGLGIEGGRTELLDVNVTCLSFLKALDIAAMHIAAGRAERILIVSADAPSLSIDEVKDPQTAAIFSDGATAIVLRPGKTEILAFKMLGWPEAAQHCEIQSGGTRYPAKTHPDQLVENGFFKMDGKGLMKTTIKALPEIVEALQAQSGLTLDDIDLIIPHQGSPGGLDVIERRMGFDPDRFLKLATRRGNRVSASLPDGLIEAMTKNLIKPGRTTMLLGTASGLSAGGMILTEKDE